MKSKLRHKPLEYDNNGRLVAKDHSLTLIPYYAWAHRGSGNMAVWLPYEVNATRPTAIPTLASKSKVDASHKGSSLSFYLRRTGAKR